MSSNLFSSPRLVAVYAETHSAGRLRHASVTVADQQFELPVIASAVGGHRAARLPFFDFYEPTSSAITGSPRLASIPQAAVRSVPVAALPSAEALTAGDIGGAPYIRWVPGVSWQTYVEDARARSQRVFDAKRASQRERTLARACGPLRFVPRSDDPALIDLCFDWKAARYIENAWLFRDERKRAFFRALHAVGLLDVAVLHAGSTPIAIALCMHDSRRFYYWVPAFHPDRARASPGGHLLELLIEDSHRAGLLEIDFLARLEPYKLGYATDVRLIGPFGRNHLVGSVARRSRRWLGRNVKRAMAAARAAVMW